MEEVNEETIEETTEETVENNTEETTGEEEEFLSDNVPENSFLKEYFEKLQVRLSEEDEPREYLNGTFWVQSLPPAFVFLRKMAVNTLYQPKVFLWLPHHLLPQKMSSLKCPDCNSRIKSKGYNKNPHARRVVDLSE